MNQWYLTVYWKSIDNYRKNERTIVPVDSFKCAYRNVLNMMQFPNPYVNIEYFTIKRVHIKGGE